MKFKIIFAALVCLAVSTAEARRCSICCGSGVVKKLKYTYNGSVRVEVDCNKCNGTGETGSSSSYSSSRYKSSSRHQTNDLAYRKSYLRDFVSKNGIGCSSIAELAETNNVLVKKMMAEDESLRSDIAAFEHVDMNEIGITRSAGTWHKDEHGDFVVNDETVLDVPMESHRCMSHLIRSAYNDLQMKLRIRRSCLKHYKTSCDVHMWDDECRPTFEGDYYTYDVKVKYASNRMKALEMAEQGVLKCTCQKSKEEWLRAHNSLTAEQEAAAMKWTALVERVEAFERNRIEDITKHSACIEAKRQFENIRQIVKARRGHGTFKRHKQVERPGSY